MPLKILSTDDCKKEITKLEKHIIDYKSIISTNEILTKEIPKLSIINGKYVTDDFETVQMRATDISIKLAFINSKKINWNNALDFDDINTNKLNSRDFF